MQNREIIERIVERIKVYYQPSKIVLFGSYAEGNASPESDVDLLIVKNTSQNRLQRWMAVRRILREFLGDISIQPLVYTEQELAERVALGDFFLREILRKGIVLYERGTKETD